MCLAPRLTRCHRSELLNGYCCCQPLSTPGICFFNLFACPSASYHVVHYLYIILMIIDSFFRVFPHKNFKCESQRQLWISLYISRVLSLYSQSFESTYFFHLEADIFDSIPVIYIWTGHCQNNPDM